MGNSGAKGSMKGLDLGVSTKPRSADPGLGSRKVEADGNPPYQLVQLGPRQLSEGAVRVNEVFN